MEILTCDISSSKLSSFAICCSSCGSPAGQIFPTRSITEASLSMSEDWLSNNWPSEGEIQLHNLHIIVDIVDIGTIGLYDLISRLAIINVRLNCEKQP
uniref:Uncharacterized protein n=1 Tax=Aegilops tauschii TaxID=37682 RepID=M8BUM8_AEGTA